MRRDQILELAARQWSMVTTWQLRALGMSRHQIMRLRQGREWEPLTHRVLVRRGVRLGREHWLMAAVLDASPGAIVSHGSGIGVWLGDRWYGNDAIDVTRHRGISRRGSCLATVHEVIDLLPSHVKVVRGIPVASPARLVFDMAATARPARVERLLDTFWSNGLLDGRTLDRTVRELAARGRAGSALMRELNEARGPGYVPPASGLEHRFQQVLRAANERPMRRQVDSGDGEWCARVDFRDDEVPLVVEVQSERFHSSLADEAADEARKARLREAGFIVVEAWDIDVWHRPSTVVDQVRRERRALRSARRLTA